MARNEGLCQKLFRGFAGGLMATLVGTGSILVFSIDSTWGTRPSCTIIWTDPKRMPATLDRTTSIHFRGSSGFSAMEDIYDRIPDQEDAGGSRPAVRRLVSSLIFLLVKCDLHLLQNRHAVRSDMRLLGTSRLHPVHRANRTPLWQSSPAM